MLFAAEHSAASIKQQNKLKAQRNFIRKGSSVFIAQELRLKALKLVRIKTKFYSRSTQLVLNSVEIYMKTQGWAVEIKFLPSPKVQCFGVKKTLVTFTYSGITLCELN